MVQQALDTAKLVHKAPVFYFPEIDSTNTKAIEMGRSGAAHLACVVAEEQTAGRGRRGKSWHTLPYASIAASFVVRKPMVEVMPLLASLVVFRVLKKFSPQSPTIKWPNDVRINGQKISGILVERVGSERSGFYVVGIGMNINQAPAFSTQNKQQLCTLADICGKQIPREAVLQALCTELTETLQLVQSQGWAALSGVYAENCETLGKRVLWQSPDGAIDGIAHALTADGGLVLKTAKGFHMVYSGQIVEQGGIHPKMAADASQSVEEGNA